MGTLDAHTPFLNRLAAFFRTFGCPTAPREQVPGGSKAWEVGTEGCIYLFMGGLSCQRIGKHFLPRLFFKEEVVTH